MMWALIVDDVVWELTDIDPADRFHPSMEWVKADATVEVGWAREKDGRLKAPAQEQAPATSSRLSFLEFMDLFTEAEQLAIAGAAMTDVATKLWYDRAAGAQFIDLGDERLAAGLQKMVDAKLLTAARRTRVLKGSPPA